MPPEINIHDHTLVWATHPDIDQAAVLPRSNLVGGWTEVDRQDPTKNPKVQAALEAGTEAPPGQPDALVADPATTPSAAVKEK